MLHCHVAQKHNLEDALVIAGFLNVFVRNADIVKMANMAQLVNVIAPIWAEKEGYQPPTTTEMWFYVW
jgi:alpha-L-arabinofuranosidase